MRHPPPRDPPPLFERRRRPVRLAALALLFAACANPDKPKAPPTQAAIQLALRNARCVLLAKVLPVEEVARTCARAPQGVEELPASASTKAEGARCAYRFEGMPTAALEVHFLGPAEAAGRALRAELAPAAPRVTPALGPHGLAYYDGKRGQYTFFFDVRGEGVRVSATQRACEAGPLSRVVGALRERLGAK